MKMEEQMVTKTEMKIIGFSGGFGVGKYYKKE
jgi:hypothetical protein